MSKKEKVLPDPNHPVVRGIRWILENRLNPSGEKWAARNFSEAAGLNSSHISGMLNGYQTLDISRETALGIAKAGNVRVGWLLTGKGVREPFDEEEGGGIVEQLVTALERRGVIATEASPPPPPLRAPSPTKGPIKAAAPEKTGPRAKFVDTGAAATMPKKLSRPGKKP